MKNNILIVFNFLFSPAPLIILGFLIGAVASDRALDLDISDWWCFGFVIAGVISFIVRRVYFKKKK